ncbi:MAG: 4-oxalocrotonate tautomerase, partial [Clostridia bacterium]
TLVLNEYFEKGAGKNMSEKTRTLAFQVSEELFRRVKKHLDRNPGLKQKEFVIGLIEQALDAAEAAIAAE